MALEPAVKRRRIEEKEDEVVILSRNPAVQILLFETFLTNNVDHFRTMCSIMKIGLDGTGPVYLLKESFYSLVRWRNVDIVREAMKYSPLYEADVIMEALRHPFPGTFSMVQLIAELCFDRVTPEIIKNLLTDTEKYLNENKYGELKSDEINFADYASLNATQYEESLGVQTLYVNVNGQRSLIAVVSYPRLIHACLKQIVKRIEKGEIPVYEEEYKGLLCN